MYIPREKNLVQGRAYFFWCMYQDQPEVNNIGNTYFSLGLIYAVHSDVIYTYLVGVDPGFGPNPKNPGNSKNSEPE